VRLSVVVPAYNVERYLPACLESLVGQARPIDEILVVDDSSDGSTAIAEAFARRHPALRVVRGPGRDVASARNLGLDLARGDWIGLVDADDWIERDMYARLLGHAEAYALDMVLCNARTHFNSAKPDKPLYDDHPPSGPMPGADWLAAKLENRTFLHAVWMHVYRRAFLEEHRLRFPVGVQHEDVVWTTRELALAKQVYYDDAPLYVYRAAQADASTSPEAAEPHAGDVGSRTMAYVVRNPQRFSRAALDERLLRVIEGAKYNARALAELAAGAGNARLASAVRWQLVEGGLSVFHKIRQLSAIEARHAQWRKVLADGFLGLLWCNAEGFRQRRKVAARAIRAYALSRFKG